METQARAFSQFELTIVMVIISLFLLFFTPRLKQLAERGHQAVVRGDTKALEGVLRLAQVRYSIAQLEGPVANMQGFSDGTIDFNSQGFPNSVSRGATDNAPLTDHDCVDLWNHLLDVNASTASVASDTRYHARIRPRMKQFSHTPTFYCEYLYQPVEGMNIRYFPQEGRVTYVIP